MLSGATLDSILGSMELRHLRYFVAFPNYSSVSVGVFISLPPVAYFWRTRAKP